MVKSMSYLDRTMPYMRYGTVDISSATNVNEALELSDMNWFVDSKPLYDENGDIYGGFCANVRDKDNALLGIVSDKYRIVQNEDAFNFVNDLSTEGFEFDRAGVFKNGKSIWLMGHFPKETILGDEIDNNIVLVNSHDGSSGVKVMMTPVRVICANMLNLALKSAERSWNTRHTKSIYSKIDEAKHTLGLVDIYMKALNEEAERLANINISDDKIEEIFDKLFPVDANDSETKIRNISILKDNFIRCYDEADIKQFKGTVYGAVNAMADLVDHRVPNRQTANYYENNWNRMINGHSILDNFYRLAK